MANTLHDNIVVKSKVKASINNEDKLTLLRHDFGQAGENIKSQPLPTVSYRVSDSGTGTKESDISKTDTRLLGKRITKATVLKNTILDAYQQRYGPDNGHPIITTKTGEPTQSSTIILSISNLVTAPIMRPNNRRSYRIKDLDIFNILVIAIRHQDKLKTEYDYAIEDEDYRSMCLISKHFPRSQLR